MADNAKQRFTLKKRTSPAGAAEQQASEDDGDDDARHWLIRANQGHSIKLASEGLHTRITLGDGDGAGNVPPVVVHGTYFVFWPAILAAGGLKKMGRTHVHFGTGLPEDGRAGGAPSSSPSGPPGPPPPPSQQQQTHEVADEESAAGSKKVISGMRSDAELLMFVDVEQSLRDGGIEWWLSSNGVVLTEGDADGVVPLRYFREVRGRRQGVGLLWKDGEKVADLPEGTVARMPHGKAPGGGGGGGSGRRGGQRGGRQ